MHDGSLARRALHRVGTTLCGRYRLVDLLGVGGMAAVYTGVHRNGHVVAIKILHERLSNDPEIDRLFRREALLANKIAHPCIVPVIDDDVAEDGCTFLVMPLLEGETLRARVERLGGRLPVAEVLVVAHAVLGALAVAHERKIVHRDIKPENLFLTRDGSIRVLDFGIARFFESSDPASATRSGRAVGTPAFMAPEQALGRLHDIDGRSDIWALGATMFTLLTGRIVHDAPSASETLVLAATRPPTPISEVWSDGVREICEIVDRALSFDRAQRWPEASSMAEALDHASESCLGQRIARVAPLVPPPSTEHDGLYYAPTQLGVPPQPREPGPSLSGSIPDSSAAEASALRVAITRTLKLGELRPQLRVWVSLAAAFAFAFTGVAGIRAVQRYQQRRAATTVGGPDAVTSAPDVAHDSPGRAYYEAGLRAMYSASTNLALALFEKATEADPSLAAAHLRYVALMSTVDDSVRTHFSAADRFRDSLAPEDRDLLDALAPLTTAAPDNRLPISRLEAASLKYPQSRTILLVLARRFLAIGDTRAAAKTADRALALEPELAAAWQIRGAALLELSDADEGRRSYLECLRRSPRATSCLRDLGDLSLLDGRCDEAVQYSRALIADDPQNSEWYYRLALATFGATGNLQAAHEELLQSWRLKPEAAREAQQLLAEANIALVQGQFTEGLHVLDALDHALEGVPSDIRHMSAARTRMLTFVELGDRTAAINAARSFLSRASAWNRTSEVDFRIYALDVLYGLGGIDADAFRQQRDAWARSSEAHAEGTPALRWLLGWATPARDAQDATDALRALPRETPFEPPTRRDPESEEAIGRTYLLAGRPNDAIPHLKRGAAACIALATPIDSTHAALALAEAASANSPAVACDAYATVERRWGREPRSISAALARAGTAKLQCNHTFLSNQSPR